VYWCVYPSIVFWSTGTCQAKYFVGSWWEYLLGDRVHRPIWVTPSGRTIFETNQNSESGKGGRVFRRRSKRMYVKLTTHFYLVPRLWRRGGIPPPFLPSRRGAFLGTGATLHLCQLVKKYPLVLWDTTIHLSYLEQPACGPEAEPRKYTNSLHILTPFPYDLFYYFSPTLDCLTRAVSSLQMLRYFWPFTHGKFDLLPPSCLYACWWACCGEKRVVVTESFSCNIKINHADVLGFMLVNYINP